MSYYLKIDDEIGQQIASNKGWGDFGAWAESLEDAPAIRELWDQGYTDDVAALAEELKNAAPPKDADTKSIVAELREAIGDSDAAIVGISDGFE